VDLSTSIEATYTSSAKMVTGSEQHHSSFWDRGGPSKHGVRRTSQFIRTEGDQPAWEAGQESTTVLSMQPDFTVIHVFAVQAWSCFPHRLPHVFRLRNSLFLSQVSFKAGRFQLLKLRISEGGIYRLFRPPQISVLEPFLPHFQSLTSLHLHKQGIKVRSLSSFVRMLQNSDLPGQLKVLTLWELFEVTATKTRQLLEGVSQMTMLEKLIVPDWFRTYEANKFAVTPLLHMNCLRSVEVIFKVPAEFRNDSLQQSKDAFKRHGLPLNDLGTEECSCQT
jgi:hypothetical protein